MLQEVTLRSHCLQKTIMAHTEVCVCDGVMCKHLCECVCARALTAPLSPQGTAGVRLCRWERLRKHDANSQGKENMVSHISSESETHTQKRGAFTFLAPDRGSFCRVTYS